MEDATPGVQTQDLATFRELARESLDILRGLAATGVAELEQVRRSIAVLGAMRDAGVHSVLNDDTWAVVPGLTLTLAPPGAVEVRTWTPEGRVLVGEREIRRFILFLNALRREIASEAEQLPAPFRH